MKIRTFRDKTAKSNNEEFSTQGTSHHKRLMDVVRLGKKMARCSAWFMFFTTFTYVSAYRTTPEYWNRVATDELENSLKLEYFNYSAKNVIIFIGDGMGPGTVTAARIFRGGESSSLSWEYFDHMGLLKTYTHDKQVPDSAATATALFTGVKTNYRTIGVSSEVEMGDCQGSLVPRNRLESVAGWAQNKGLATGFVTTTRVTHATPSALYAHTSNRDWECDIIIPENSTCKDIARELIEDYPGKGLNVIMGGGRQNLVAKPDRGGSPLSHRFCHRGDGRNLINEWLMSKKNANARAITVNTTRELEGVDFDKYDYLMGIFEDDHLQFNHKRDKGPDGTPSLEQMTTSAIRILKNNEKGFFLMVEGGLIDQAHHNGLAGVALDETLQLNEAVNSTMLLLQKLKIKKDTLVIVTSDHSHTLTINGYPKKGNNILGVAQVSPIDNTPYTTLSYSTVGHENYKFTIKEGKVVREDPSKVDTTSFSYHQPGMILSKENLHGGVDVAVHATGPMAHLFHKTHEQNYVAHVIQYALRIGRYSQPENESLKSVGSRTITSWAILVPLVLKLFDI